MSTARSNLAPAATVLALEGLAYAIVLPHLPVVVGRYAPWWAVGALLAVYSSAQFFALTPISNAVRRFGARSVISLCLLGTTLGMVLTALATNYWILLAGRLIDGLSAGTVVVATTACLRTASEAQWTATLGKLAAVRGGAILGGILISGAVGLATSDPGSALRITAWIGAALPVLAIGDTRRLVGHAEPVAADANRTGQRTRRHLLRHVAAQAGQSGLLVLAPALALIVTNQTTSFLAPGAVIVGLGMGQLMLAPRWKASVMPFWSIGLVLVAGAALALIDPLISLWISGIAVGTLAPIAQSDLLRSRIADGADDLEANALAGRAAIVGQIWGPATGYGALSVGVRYASPAVSIVAAVAIGRPAHETAPSPT